MTDWGSPGGPPPGGLPPPPAQAGWATPAPAAWAAQPQATGPWRSPTGLANALRVLFIIAAAAVVGVAGLALSMRTALVDVDEGGGNLFDAEDAVGAFIAVAGLAGLLSLAILICLMIWMFRLAKNHELIGRPGTTFGPGWAIGAWFIPLASLVIPILQFQQLWQGADASHPRGDPAWKQVAQSPLLWAWWVTYAVGAVLAGVGYAQIQPTEEVEGSGGDVTVLDFLANLDGVKSGVTLVILGCVALLAAAVLGVFVVLRLSRRQADAAQALGIPTGGVSVPQSGAAWSGGPAQAQTSTTPAGWYPDPQGRADHRYWDGSRWTDQVSRNGQQGIDPM